MSETRDLRLTFYHPSFERGGLERFSIDTANALAGRGVSVDVLTARKSEYASQFDDSVDVRDVSAPRLVDRLLRILFPIQVAMGISSLPKTIWYLLRNVPDTYISLQLHAIGIVPPIVSRTDAKVVIRESNSPSLATDSPNVFVGRFSPLTKRITYPMADDIVAISKGAKEDIAEFLGIDPNTISVIYNPTYSPRLGEQAAEPLDHEWFDGEVPVVVSSGRFSDQKDFETLLRAFALVNESRAVRLVLLGDGKNRDRLEELVEELGLTDSVDFHGYVSNPHKYVARADLYVFSSNFEGLGNALIEAIAVGTPAVATDCPDGPSETLLEGAGGWLVPIGDHEAMATAVEEALEDEELAAQKLARAKDGLDRFTPERVAEQYISLTG